MLIILPWRVNVFKHPQQLNIQHLSVRLITRRLQNFSTPQKPEPLTHKPRHRHSIPSSQANMFSTMITIYLRTVQICCSKEKVKSKDQFHAPKIRAHWCQDIFPCRWGPLLTSRMDGNSRKNTEEGSEDTIEDKGLMKIIQGCRRPEYTNSQHQVTRLFENNAKIITAALENDEPAMMNNNIQYEYHRQSLTLLTSR